MDIPESINSDRPIIVILGTFAAATITAYAFARVLFILFPELILYDKRHERRTADYGQSYNMEYKTEV